MILNEKTAVDLNAFSLDCWVLSLECPGLQFEFSWLELSSPYSWIWVMNTVLWISETWIFVFLFLKRFNLKCNIRISKRWIQSYYKKAMNLFEGCHTFVKYIGVPLWQHIHLPTGSQPPRVQFFSSWSLNDWQAQLKSALNLILRTKQSQLWRDGEGSWFKWIPLDFPRVPDTSFGWRKHLCLRSGTQRDSSQRLCVFHWQHFLKLIFQSAKLFGI